MYADFHKSSAYQNLSQSNLELNQDQEKKVDVRDSSSFASQDGSITTEDLSEEGDNIFLDINSVHSQESQKRELFLGKEIEQVETSSRSYEILKAGYRNSNRGAVALGVVGGIVGGALQGGPGVAFGMSVGSSVGSSVGALGGVVIESSKSSNEEKITDPEARVLEANNNRFFGHVVQLVDQSGHYAAVGSMAVGIGALLTALVTGNPLPVALHAAGVYSGVTWAFGLTTGSAHWILDHLQRSEKRLEREQTSSSGDIELRSWTSLSLKEVEDDKDTTKSSILTETK